MATEDWPDAREFPYVALIRIRYVHELDILLIRQLQHAVAAAAAPQVSRGFMAETNRIALDQVAVKPVELTADVRGQAVTAFDPDGWCGNGWLEQLLEWLRRHGPVPGPGPGDPVYLGADLALTLIGAREMVSAVASEAVARKLTDALTQVAEQAGQVGQRTR